MQQRAILDMRRKATVDDNHVERLLTTRSAAAIRTILKKIRERSVAECKTTSAPLIITSQVVSASSYPKEIRNASR
jgi:hypothetical protein